MTKISVIVPVYNVDRYLSRCLDSLINQSFGDYEILLINDGSTDNSLEICQRYQQFNPNLIKVYSKSNGGLSDARNYGLDKCDSDFVVFVDSDDWIDLNMLNHMYSRATTTNADLVVCDMEYHFEGGIVKSSCGGEFDVVKVEDNINIMMINNSACNKLYRYQLFDNIRFPKGFWYEDMAVVPILILKSSLIAKVNEPLYKYYQREGSIMHSVNEKIFDIYRVIDMVKEYIVENYNGETLVRLLNNIDNLYLIHGLDINTLQIRLFNKDRILYLKKNMSFLSKRVPYWYQSINEYSLKKKIVFGLLKFKLYRLLLFIYDIMAKKGDINV